MTSYVYPNRRETERERVVERERDMAGDEKDLKNSNFFDFSGLL